MFSPQNSQKHASEIPSGCTFNKNDWYILAGFWNSIVYSNEALDKPIRAHLLDVDLVVLRTDEGVSVARDLYPRHGTRLSQGWITPDISDARAALWRPMTTARKPSHGRVIPIHP
ncbi:hypothetical protein PHLH5_33180 [Pseudomonas sp. Cab53]|uniref:hypothetical protein n=1 Tax=Pseudomonas TaxID=286 RepID=UPI001910AD7F|nr:MULTISPECIES: hypothetical protein [Pseudomonas]BBH32624.1 putative oxygenase [Pseudomonas sp. St290]BBP65777.1 hypothetical protein PHLH5_33180 [Pseudomonas sp. Cab53]GFM84560.1 hypothetical protein PSCICN_52520 [Pseudomonas cichorii]